MTYFEHVKAIAKMCFEPDEVGMELSAEDHAVDDQHLCEAVVEDIRGEIERLRREKTLDIRGEIGFNDEHVKAIAKMCLEPDEARSINRGGPRRRTYGIEPSAEDHAEAVAEDIRGEIERLRREFRRPWISGAKSND
jgi:hypothetical protein